jgi:hypothetical protein
VKQTTLDLFRQMSHRQRRLRLLHWFGQALAAVLSVSMCRRTSVQQRASNRYSWPITACHEGQLTTDSVEKVGHGLRVGKVRVRD